MTYLYTCLIEIINTSPIVNKFLYILITPFSSESGLCWKIQVTMKKFSDQKYFVVGFPITTEIGCYNIYQFTHHSSPSEIHRKIGLGSNGVASESRNNWRYLSCMSFLISHVAYLKGRCLHWTFTDLISFILSLLTLRWIGCSSYSRSLSNTIDSYLIT